MQERKEMPIRLVLADDHILVIRQGLRTLLEREGHQVIGEAADGLEAVKQVAALQPDVVIMDVSMPNLNGIDAIREISASVPATKAILLTQLDEDVYVSGALEAGVRGYVLKSQVAGDLLNAVQRVSSGQVYLSPGVSQAVVAAYRTRPQKSSDPLTLRERQVLQLIAEGKSTKDVASILFISVKTAESHRSRLMQKLDIHETASLVRYAIRRGLVRP
jgi:two-component system, NarL family, response regulator NreC